MINIEVDKEICFKCIMDFATIWSKDDWIEHLTRVSKFRDKSMWEEEFDSGLITRCPEQEPVGEIYGISRILNFVPNCPYRLEHIMKYKEKYE